MNKLTEVERQHLDCLIEFRIEPAGVIKEYHERKGIFGHDITLSDFIEGCLVVVGYQKIEQLSSDPKTSRLAEALKRPVNHVANYGFEHLEPKERRDILESFKQFRTTLLLNEHTKIGLPVNWDIIEAPTRYSICGLLKAVEI